MSALAILSLALTLGAEPAPAAPPAAPTPATAPAVAAPQAAPAGQPANLGGQAATPGPETPKFVSTPNSGLGPVPHDPSFRLSLSTLQSLRKQGILSQAQYDDAMQDLIEVGSHARTAPTLVAGKFATTMYGFIEADMIHDSTRSFIDLAGMGGIAQPGSENGDNGRTMFGVRNSRFGFHLTAPETNGIRASGWLEMDFLGNQPGAPPLPGFKEAPFWNNPGLRVRHFLLKLDNDVVALWFGQTWELIGWQAAFQPNTVAIQGVPGELYSRTPQLRLVKAIKLGPTTLEVAGAALRPPQMDSEVPDLQAGLKLSVDHWTGVQTVGAAGTSIAPASIALSGGLRNYKLVNGSNPDSLSSVWGNALAADVMLPILTAKRRKEWALTFVGEASTGTGDADLFTGLTGNAAVGAPSGFGGGVKSYAALADIDPGLAGWGPSGALETIDWRSLIVSAQLYLPPNGDLWLAASYSNTYSDNIGDFGAPTSVFNHEMWWDVNLFADITPSTRLGLEYSHFNEVYLNGVQAPNDRVQLSAFYIF
ncbi:MAG: hypothetical protein ACYCWW_10030 [Deltaproteobacteria bacterium]